jgi:DNA-binding NarL/FixJ family response regulator
MNPGNKIRIMVVDDHPLIRTGLCAIIAMQADMCVVGEYEDAESLLAAIRTQTADMVLIDLRLPGISGLAAIKALHEKFPEVRTIVITTYEGDEDIHQSLLAGASSYVIKGMPHEILLQIVRKTFKVGKYIPPEIKQRINARPIDEISARERDVLVLMGKGLSNKEIADYLGIAEKTVKCHISKILLRLGVKDRTRAVLVGIRRGYVRV